MIGVVLSLVGLAVSAYLFLTMKVDVYDGEGRCVACRRGRK